MYKKMCCRTKIVPSRCFEPFRKQESYEVKRCVNCCHQPLTKHLISGFAGISNSKRSPRKATKMCVFLICMVGFFYQTWTFLELYLAYPISQDTSENYPEEITAPAITICNDNRLFRQRVFAMHPEDFIWQPIDSLEEYCEQHKKWCNYNEGKWEFDLARPEFHGGFKFERGNYLLHFTGPQNETDLIDFCMIQIDGIDIYCNSSIMIQAPKDGFPHRCFSLFSLLGKPNEEPLKLSSDDSYFIALVMHPEEYINEDDLVQAWLVFHDPHKSVNPFTEGVPLKAGRFYKLYPTMKRKISLPPPYASKCVDYIDEWKKNGGYGPLSKMDCIDLCLMKAMVEKSGCVEQEITYPNNFTICQDQRIDAEFKMLKKCSSMCRESCEEDTYSFTSQVTDDYSVRCHRKDERCQNSLLLFQVYFNRLTIQKFQHTPRFEGIELFSYIGGYLGMWLGIALASMYDFSEVIYDTVYPLLKGRKK